MLYPGIPRISTPWTKNCWLRPHKHQTNEQTDEIRGTDNARGAYSALPDPLARPPPCSRPFGTPASAFQPCLRELHVNVYQFNNCPNASYSSNSNVVLDSCLLTERNFRILFSQFSSVNTFISFQRRQTQRPPRMIDALVERLHI